MAKCIRCGNEFPSDQLTDYKGWPHCNSCYGVVTAAPAPRAIAPQVESVPGQPSPIATPLGPTAVRLVEIDLTFGNMVGFMVKWAIAAIPAVIIIAVLLAMLWGALGALVSGR